MAVFLAGLAILAAYAVGFVVFVETLQLTPSTLDHPDAVVVPTGGDGRLPIALKLFESGVGARLLITGADPGTTTAKLKEAVHGGNRIDCCVDLDFSAANTRDNAAVTSEWVRRHDYHRLVIVTANYHMPRCLAEFSAVMPNVKFEPWPTRPNGINVKDWWNNPRTFKTLRREYTKFLVVLILTHFATKAERNAIDPARERGRFSSAFSLVSRVS